VYKFSKRVLCDHISISVNVYTDLFLQSKSHGVDIITHNPLNMSICYYNGNQVKEE